MEGLPIGLALRLLAAIKRQARTLQENRELKLQFLFFDDGDEGFDRGCGVLGCTARRDSNARQKRFCREGHHHGQSRV